VRFTLNLGPGLLPISGQGHVVRVEGGGRYALAFDAIAHADRQRLIHFIFERQRDALAKGAHITPLNRKRRRSER
jgi:c-di-GMP-binding flagellar brake protein YcgR